MTRITPVLSFLLLLAAGWAAPSRAASSMSDTLADSTVVEHWTLANGLRVITRHVPDGEGVAISLAYGIGSDDDPEGREGLAQVLGHLAFTGPAGDVPERTREDLDSQRPLGWSYPVSRRTTLLTEVASVDQFPGVLRQIAQRMRGVRVTKEALQASIRDVKNEMSQQLFGPPSVSLYHQVREVGLDRKDEDLVRRASGRDLARITVAEAQQQLGRHFVPANAVLSLAGNVKKVDARVLIQSLFADIPGGSPRASRSQPALQARTRVLRLEGVQAPAGVVGVVAPALSDSAHPSFYLNVMLLGSHFVTVWRKPGDPPGTSYYHYALFDEPDLVRVFPPVEAGVQTAEAVSERMTQALNAFHSLIVTREVYDELRNGTLWLLGGPMRPEIAARARREPMLLHSLARSMATRGLWHGEAFWKEYRERFAAQTVGGLGDWMNYVKDPRHQIAVLLLRR